jgi:hypothetical protein
LNNFEYETTSAQAKKKLQSKQESDKTRQKVDRQNFLVFLAFFRALKHFSIRMRMEKF